MPAPATEAPSTGMLTGHGQGVELGGWGQGKETWLSVSGMGARCREREAGGAKCQDLEARTWGQDVKAGGGPVSSLAWGVGRIATIQTAAQERTGLGVKVPSWGDELRYSILVGVWRTPPGEHR